jgi:hypothetical protein
MSTLADFSCSIWNVENAALAILQEPRVPLVAIGNRKEQHIQPTGKKKKYERETVRNRFWFMV